MTDNVSSIGFFCIIIIVAYIKWGISNRFCNANSEQVMLNHKRRKYFAYLGRFEFAYAFSEEISKILLTFSVWLSVPLITIILRALNFIFDRKERNTDDIRFYVF